MMRVGRWSIRVFSAVSNDLGQRIVAAHVVMVSSVCILLICRNLSVETGVVTGCPMRVHLLFVH
jgi:hypothetical protein